MENLPFPGKMCFKMAQDKEIIAECAVLHQTFLHLTFFHS